MRGNWKSAYAILLDQPALLISPINVKEQTILHIVVASRNVQFVKKLLQAYKDINNNINDLALKDNRGNTAFCFATASGSVDIALELIERNATLPTLPGCEGLAPIHIAALFGQTKMVQTLSKYSSFDSLGYSLTEHGHLFLAIVSAEIFGQNMRKLVKDGFIIMKPTKIHSFTRQEKRTSLWLRVANKGIVDESLERLLNKYRETKKLLRLRTRLAEKGNMLGEKSVGRGGGDIQATAPPPAQTAVVPVKKSLRNT
ncbi:unnamed protein product [Arabis nemorensis]|uniref:Uncharacterized protein n=1 Tax=Arabis nemorensis TaxID=586526 RepID=A0A565BZU9_9BRAS|nr:unnamed protein product [Arabis nemorensis]